MIDHVFEHRCDNRKCPLCFFQGFSIWINPFPDRADKFVEGGSE